MRLQMKRLDRYGDFNDNARAQAPAACEDVSLIEVAREEHAALRDFIGVLQREREVILSLSLKDITQTNCEKEEIVKTLASLRKRRQAYLGCAPESRKEQQSEEYLALAGTIELNMREAKKYLRKNRVLLSLSAGRVKSVMEFIAGSLKSSSATYGREAKRGPVLFSRRV